MNGIPTAAHPSRNGALESTKSAAEAKSGIGPETIVLETADIELEAEIDFDDVATALVREKFVLRNRMSGTTTEIAHVHDHHLMIRQRRAGKRQRFALIDLRYLHSRPALARREARKTLAIALTSSCASAATAGLAFLSVFTMVSALLAAGMACTALAALWVYACRTTETVSFRTAEGGVSVFVLRANIGCLRACRAIVPHLVAAIAAARQAIPADRRLYLRREMREHYRLRKAGVLSAEACDAGTRRILGKF